MYPLESVSALVGERRHTSILSMRWGTMRAVVCTWYEQYLDFYYRRHRRRHRHHRHRLSPLTRNDMKTSRVIFDTERWMPSNYNPFQFWCCWEFLVWPGAGTYKSSDQMKLNVVSVAIGTKRSNAVRAGRVRAHQHTFTHTHPHIHCRWIMNYSNEQ